MPPHTHSHATTAADLPQDAASVARRRRALRFMLVLLVPVALATAAGLVLLWPSSGEGPAQRAAAGAVPPGLAYPQATVLRLRTEPCADPSLGGHQTCVTAVVRIDDGIAAGEQVSVDLPPDAVASRVGVGTQLVLTRQPAAGPAPGGSDPGGAQTGAGGVTYQFEDFARGTPIVVLSLAFVVVVGLVARLRGLAAVLGLGVAFLVLLAFMLPALLHGESPTWVSLVGSAAIMFVVLYLAHGFSVRTTTALVGTLFGLALVAVLGAIAVGVARLTGFSSEATLQLQQFDPTLNFSGLVLAGVVVAGLGVLNDVTVTQASAVWELSEASPDLGWRPLFTRGMAIGRDHIASTVYTIAFAYAGASLPLLMLFELYHRPFWTVLTGAEVGEEVIRIMVGAIALVLAVPVTTAVGAVFAALAAQPAGVRGREVLPHPSGPSETPGAMPRPDSQPQYAGRASADLTGEIPRLPGNGQPGMPPVPPGRRRAQEDRHTRGPRSAN